MDIRVCMLNTIMRLDWVKSRLTISRRVTSPTRITLRATAEQLHHPLILTLNRHPPDKTPDAETIPAVDSPSKETC